MMNEILTRFHGTMDVRPRLVVDPIETSFDGEPCQHSVFRAIPIARRHVDGTSLVMQRIRRVFSFLVPALRHPQLHPWPLIHYRDSEGVQLLLAPLQHKHFQRLIQLIKRIY